MMTIQKYVRARSLEEAWELNQSRNNRILGGMMWLRMGSGSMNTANAAELLAQPDVDGGLIGGASLKTESFEKIIEAANQ